MKDATEVNEKDLKAAIVALNATGMLEEKIVVKGKTVEDLMETLLDGVEELDEAQQSTLPATVINVYNDLIADEVAEPSSAESEEEGEDDPDTQKVERAVSEKEKKEEKADYKEKSTGAITTKAKTKEAAVQAKAEKKKGPSATDFAMRFICDNPRATEADIQKALDKAGMRILSTATIDYLLKEVGYIIGYLKESKRIK